MRLYVEPGYSQEDTVQSIKRGEPGAFVPLVSVPPRARSLGRSGGRGCGARALVHDGRSSRIVFSRSRTRPDRLPAPRQSDRWILLFSRTSFDSPCSSAFRCRPLDSWTIDDHRTRIREACWIFDARADGSLVSVGTFSRDRSPGLNELIMECTNCYLFHFFFRFFLYLFSFNITGRYVSSSKAAVTPLSHSTRTTSSRLVATRSMASSFSVSSRVVFLLHILFSPLRLHSWHFTNSMYLYHVTIDGWYSARRRGQPLACAVTLYALLFFFFFALLCWCCFFLSFMGRQVIRSREHSSPFTFASRSLSFSNAFADWAVFAPPQGVVSIGWFYFS